MEAWRKPVKGMPPAAAGFSGLGTRLAGCLEYLSMRVRMEAWDKA